MFAKLAGLIILSLVASTSLAATAPSATVTHPSIIEPAGPVGVAYFTVTSTTNDAITGVMSDCCEALELHRSEKINGIMSMRKISKLVLAKNTPLPVQPGAHGGEHLMLIGLTKPLKDGDTVAITFSFEKAPTQTVTFPVVRATAAADAHDHH